MALRHIWRLLTEREKQRLKKIGDNIRKERMRQNLSQANIAFELNTSIKQFQRIEGGEINTGIISLFRIAASLNVPIEKILKNT